MTRSKRIKTISKSDFDSFVNNLIKDNKYEVVGVKAKGKRYVFDIIEDADELRLDYDVTILPPKKYFLPPVELLMNYDLKNSYKPQELIDEKTRIIIGIHPYDIVAIEQADKVYLDSQKDDFYKKRRENTIIIGSDIQNVSERSFAASMGTNIVESGFDLLLTYIGKKYTITIGTKKGNELLEKFANVREPKNSEIRKIQKTRENTALQYKRKINIPKEEWSNYLVANYDNSFWEARSDKCLECSSCTMVCPTCYCYDVIDDVSLNLSKGVRLRTWDGCLLRDFTKVASGEVFRENIRDRYRHRFYRKGNYLPERYGFVACVGCGRCGIACLPDIADPCDALNELSRFEKSDDTGKFFIKQKSKAPERGIIHVPRSATIKRVEKLNKTETLFELDLDDKKSLGHKPGQFVEVSILGIGEAPIAVSSAPTKNSSFEIIVRKVGNVTTKLFTLKKGDKVGIRGPLGNGFDVGAMKNKNILFVCGGIGLTALRSLLKYVCDKNNRKQFKEITILYGCKTPSELMLLDEFDNLKKIKDLTCKLTVDRCPDGECWDGEVGLITTLFPKIKLDKSDSKNTIAVICGPPIMYKFVIQCLKTLGFPDKNIIVSLERRMKCGVGKCGHCQINGVYVCKEGPVFNYSEIKNLPEALE